MDNIYCDGSESEVTSCRFDGWGVSDCDFSEAAGVICAEEDEEQLGKTVGKHRKKTT